MASSLAIAATGQAVLGILASACPRDIFPSAQFELYQSRNFQSPMEEGVSLYLHRVTPANNIRNLPPRVAPDGRRYRPALPIDLHYMMTAWARDSTQQNKLLGWAMRCVEDTSNLPSGVLNEFSPEPEVFRVGESVDLIMETVTVQDHLAVWEIGKPNIQPSIYYTARMIILESALELHENAQVQTRTFDAGQLVLK